MSAKLIEITLPGGRAEDIRELLHGFELQDFWWVKGEDHNARVLILADSGSVEQILDILSGYLSALPGAKAILIGVDACVPASDGEQKGGGEERSLQSEKGGDEQAENNSGLVGRISRQELLSIIEQGTAVSWDFVLMVVLSAVIAAIGLVRSDTAIIIGAMVLAPLLLPNMALSLGSTLGDNRLLGRAAAVVGAGVALAIITGLLIGMVLHPSPEIPAIVKRTAVVPSDMVLAFSSGVAGVIAMLSSGHLSLIGVMVAVALMPPLVTAGLLMGGGYMSEGGGALALALVNVICINLAGIITFRFYGIRPGRWWKETYAKRAAARAIVFWLFLIALLLFILYLH